MRNNINHLLIFKTNLKKRGVKQIQSILDAHVQIQKWNIDLQDVDCVLRITSQSVTHEQIICLVNSKGFHCIELE